MGSIQEPRRCILITYPRTASSLFIKILNLDAQPSVAAMAPIRRGGNFFIPAKFHIADNGLQTKRVREWSEEERRGVKQKLQQGFDEIEEYVESARDEGKAAFFKEHSYVLADPVAQSRYQFGEDSADEEPWSIRVPEGFSAERSAANNTIFPDEYLRSWLPTFTVRHPALVFPSHYRALVDSSGYTEDRMIEEAGAFSTFYWTRSLYDCYKDTLGIEPIILEADDVISRPEVLFRYCELVGLDPEKLKFTWDAKSPEELATIKNPVVKRFTSTINASSGVLQEKAARNIDIKVEAKKWREEFGERAGSKMEERVRKAMPDYVYLNDRRLKLERE